MRWRNALCARCWPKRPLGRFQILHAKIIHHIDEFETGHIRVATKFGKIAPHCLLTGVLLSQTPEKY